MNETSFAIVVDLLKQKEIPFCENEVVSNRSSFKIGGKVRLTVFPNSVENLTFALDALSQNNVRFEIVGNASNILFAFDFFDGAMIFTGGISKLYFEQNFVIASCGVSLTRLAREAADRGLCGLEFAYGIPGLVGGSVYMNAGAYGSSMSDVVGSTLAYDIDKKQLVEIKEHAFGYRQSIYMCSKNLVCVEARFCLKHGNENDIREKMAENIRSRREKQPLEYASAGSYFKRPENNFAGKLIEDCGLKGASVGGAVVSLKHAGFIVNVGNATASDVLMLEEKIKQEVFDAFGVMLEREVRVIR